MQTYKDSVPYANCRLKKCIDFDRIEKSQLSIGLKI